MSENWSNDKNMSKHKDRRSSFHLSEISLLIALLVFTSMNFVYAENKSDFQTTNASPFYPESHFGLATAWCRLCFAKRIQLSIIPS